ncbi:hypothetical protein Tco_1066402 [Tanacetum coccineum]|uniref:Integrase, catalytic region, zinc finger, CCHC-type, peptidase aspartic, catalytic n=1 Tax=Tanacetum coccineum TaxID=301880 RepID=A0ABQ5HAG9_9ASTR
MITLVENIIVVGADNRPPTLDKSMHNSWQSCMILYIKGNEHGRMILDSILNGQLVYGTIKVDGVTRTKTYKELSDKEKLQDDCDILATNVVLQCLPPDVYSLFNHHNVAKEIWDRLKLLMQGNELSQQERECKLYNEFDRFTSAKGESLHEYYLSLQPVWSKFMTDVKLAKNMHTSNYDQLYAYLSQHEVHATEVCVMRERFTNPLALDIFQSKKPSYHSGWQSNSSASARETKLEFYWMRGIWLDNELNQKGQGMLNGSRRRYYYFMNRNLTDDLDAFDSNCDEAPSARVVLMANLSSYDSDAISEVPILDTYQDNSVLDHYVQEMYYSEQPAFNPTSYIEITSDSNIILYDQYLKETESTVVQNTTSTEQQNAVIMSVIDEISSQVAKCNAESLVNKNVNESLTTELDR